MFCDAMHVKKLFALKISLIIHYCIHTKEIQFRRKIFSKIFWCQEIKDNMKQFIYKKIKIICDACNVVLKQTRHSFSEKKCEWKKWGIIKRDVCLDKPLKNCQALYSYHSVIFIADYWVRIIWIYNNCGKIML